MRAFRFSRRCSFCGSCAASSTEPGKSGEATNASASLVLSEGIFEAENRVYLSIYCARGRLLIAAVRSATTLVFVEPG